MKATIKYPHSSRISLIIVGLFVFFATLFIAKDIIVPIVHAVVIAITLNPFVDFLIRKRFNRVLAISITLVLLLIIVATLILLLSSQLNQFINALPALFDKFYETLDAGISWISSTLNISTQEINGYVSRTKSGILNHGQDVFVNSFSTVLNSLTALVLIPVYTFMILYYRPILLNFFRIAFGKDNRREVNEILGLTKSIIHHYLLALLIETAIIAILNSVGLLIIGLKYAIILGIIGALLNLIPYLGGLMAVVLYIMIAVVTKDSISYVFYVLILYSVIQFIDNNFIVPKIVGSKVKINALVAIIGVIVGGALWGLSGMFLSIPILAILKIVFDRIDSLKPFGFLLGDDMPSLFKINSIKKKSKRK
ncbi:MAG: AI-2E family transporter [Bacteroidales bacterium]|nr:AI-2E family transporter [Bacteroidales bacterium]